MEINPSDHKRFLYFLFRVHNIWDCFAFFFFRIIKKNNVKADENIKTEIKYAVKASNSEHPCEAVFFFRNGNEVFRNSSKFLLNYS